MSLWKVGFMDIANFKFFYKKKMKKDEKLIV